MSLLRMSVVRWIDRGKGVAFALAVVAVVGALLRRRAARTDRSLPSSPSPILAVPVRREKESGESMVYRNVYFKDGLVSALGEYGTVEQLLR